MNQAVVRMQYAVRGLVPTTAEAIQEELRKGAHGRSYDEVLFCNIGNPQSVGQKPLSYYREVLALADCPWLLEKEETLKLFSKDAIDRARLLTSYMAGGTGAYSHSQGILQIRQAVAEFIQARDGYPSDPNDIFLTNGASSAIQMVLTALIASRKDAILIPIPQYPIYSALISLLRGQQIGYQLDEEAQWGLDMDEMKKQLDDARQKGLNPRGLVVINPGNPVGNVLSYDDLKSLVQFCKREGLMLLADEVYQENVYGSRPFISVKKVVRDLGPDYDDFELVSFHSTSKGITGECGRRGGYMEMCGVDPDVMAHVLKLASSQLCSNLNGQIMVDLCLHPPKPGEHSFASWKEERDKIFDGLKRKSKMVYDSLNAIEGVSCQPLEGAMYAFPKIELPRKAIEAAEEKGYTPDTFYALSLLDYTGICAVPGSGFGQKDGTYHIRLTFLPDEDKLEKAMSTFAEHHKHFMQQYS